MTEISRGLSTFSELIFLVLINFLSLLSCSSIKKNKQRERRENKWMEQLNDFKGCA